MSKQLLFALFTLFTLSFTSCIKESASSVDQDKIYTEYELFYDANTDKTYARATFRFSNITGTKLELDGTGSIQFNGDKLTFNQVLAYYEKEYAGKINNGTFRYNDLDNNTFENSVEIHPIDIPASVDSIPRNTSFNLPWVGTPLVVGEVVIAGLNNNNAINPQLFYQDDVNSTSIILAQNQLNTLFAGPATLGLERRYLPTLVQKTSAGGVITGRYKAKDRAVVLF